MNIFTAHAALFSEMSEEMIKERHGKNIISTYTVTAFE